MIAFDVQTLILVSMLFSLIFFIGMMRYARHNRRFYGLRLFAYGYCLLFAGSLLIILGDLLPEGLSVVAASIFFAAAFLLFTSGSYAFLRKYFPFLWIHLAVLLLLAGGLVYFTYIYNNLNFRILMLSLYFFAESLICSLLFIRDGAKGFRIQKNSAAAGFILFSLFCLVRIGYTLTQGGMENLLQTNLLQSLSVIGMQIIIINTSFSLFWIATSILNDDLEELAKLDPLTKILNRRAFLDELTKETARSRRESVTFSLIMADIDHFKAINDTHGHLAGDSVLIGFTSVIRVNLRINDIVARFGGEEFFILLPNTDKKQAADTAERIRRIIENLRHPFNGKEILYTASFGVTSFDIDAQNREELLENADIALYEAKTKGRNRVEVK